MFFIMGPSRKQIKQDIKTKSRDFHDGPLVLTADPGSPLGSLASGSVSSVLTSAFISSIGTSGPGCWELVSALATEDGVGTLLSMLAAAWESCGETKTVYIC